MFGIIKYQIKYQTELAKCSEEKQNIFKKYLTYGLNTINV